MTMKKTMTERKTKMRER